MGKNFIPALAQCGLTVLLVVMVAYQTINLVIGIVPWAFMVIEIQNMAGCCVSLSILGFIFKRVFSENYEMGPELFNSITRILVLLQLLVMVIATLGQAINICLGLIPYLFYIIETINWCGFGLAAFLSFGNSCFMVIPLTS